MPRRNVAVALPDVTANAPGDRWISTMSSCWWGNEDGGSSTTHHTELVREKGPSLVSRRYYYLQLLGYCRSLSVRKIREIMRRKHTILCVTRDPEVRTVSLVPNQLRDSPSNSAFNLARHRPKSAPCRQVRH
jgi:hypothetical protein